MEYGAGGPALASAALWQVSGRNNLSYPSRVQA